MCQKILDKAVLISKAGSRLYRTHTDNSDSEFRVIYKETEETLLSPLYLHGSKEERMNLVTDEHLPGWGNVKASWSNLTSFKELEGTDTQSCELRKWAYLLYKASPNFTEIVFTDDEDIIFNSKDSLVEHFRSIKESFLTKRLVLALEGFSYSSFNKMKSKINWIKGMEKPNWESFCKKTGVEPGSELLSKNEINQLVQYLYSRIQTKIAFTEEALFLKEYLDKVNLPSIMIDDAGEDIDKLCSISGFSKVNISNLKASQEFYKKVKEYKSYLSWLELRNPERKAFEERVGFDCKDMAHCVRLITMSLEVLEGKGLILNRDKAGDKDFILGIRLGKYSLEEITSYFEETKSKIEKLYKISSLPYEVSRDLFL